MFFDYKLIKTILPLLFGFIFSSSSLSQNTSYLDSLDGRYALQFQITANFSLTNFQGTILSGKYHFNKRDAIRLGLSIELDDSDAEVEHNIRDTVNTETFNNERNSFGFTVNTQYLRYITGIDNIFLFGGGGPFVHYFSSTSNGEVPTEDETETETFEYSSDIYYLGVNMILGVEWWFHKSMSLSAEYGMEFRYISRKGKDIQGEIKRNVSDNSFRINASNINFGITVYF